MIRVVLDTNVILSGLVGYNRIGSKPGEVLRAAVDGRYRLVMSDWIWNEVRDGLDIPYFRERLGPKRGASLLMLLERLSDHVFDGFPVVAVAPDSDDDPVIATAVHGAAGMLVTGDRRLQSVGRHGEVVILGIAEFLAILGPEG